MFLHDLIKSINDFDEEKMKTNKKKLCPSISWMKIEGG
jgi:hypothetical protein